MTMKEIAKKAQVSVTTVSNVVHGRRERVSRATYNKIEEVIKEYDFHLNRRAGLLAGKSQQLFVILDFGEKSTSRHYRRICMLMKHFQRKGIFTLLYFPSSEKDGICFAKEWNAKGIIIIGKFGIKEAFCKEFSGKIVVQMHLDNGIHFLL